MPYCLKLTTPELTTYGATKWEPGVWKRLPRQDYHLLCTGDVYHVYLTPTAMLYLHDSRLGSNQIILWLSEYEDLVVESAAGLAGVLSLQLIKQLKQIPCGRFSADMFFHYNDIDTHITETGYLDGVLGPGHTNWIRKVKEELYGVPVP